VAAEVLRAVRKATTDRAEAERRCGVAERDRRA